MLRAVVVAAGLLLAPLSASAIIIETVQLDFESGAQWNGTITFNDGYQGMIDTAGQLTGGSHGFNETFSWTWWNGTGQTNPLDDNGDGYLNDWLMNGTTGGSLSTAAYSMYIGLSWDAAMSLSGGLNFIDLANARFDGNEAYQDRITASRVVAVPEPATLGLLGLGLIGFAALRRKQRQA